MAGSVTWANQPYPKMNCAMPLDIPIERKSRLVIPRFEHVRTYIRRHSSHYYRHF
ncbi:hypothetical protein MUK42_15470 [Musa troglodytarum]|uniref:Uncharacterized protein n=1 Tax=Musa troglodytarum TaxID=320322 RepID=A0A9E7HF91_9LILI|nr:hypothetical protein MUK42_15471 [Musa troglodytarum]URE38539.1 hypothetical protein MUK42_15470 [Musa troglodytarum]